MSAQTQSGKRSVRAAARYEDYAERQPISQEHTNDIRAAFSQLMYLRKG